MARQFIDIGGLNVRLDRIIAYGFVEALDPNTGKPHPELAVYVDGVEADQIPVLKEGKADDKYQELMRALGEYTKPLTPATETTHDKSLVERKKERKEMIEKGRVEKVIDTDEKKVS